MAARPSLLAIALAGCVLAPMPAAAQDGAQKDDIVRKLNDPLTQYAVAGMVYAMAHAILDAPVPGLAHEPERGGEGTCALPPGSTVGDLVGTSPDQARETIIDTVPRAMRAIGVMAGAIEHAAPEFRQMAKRAREAARQR